MPLELIDTHCHIDFDVFDQDRDKILKRCQKLGVSKIVVPAVEFSSWPKLISLTSPYVQLYKAYGLHPVFLEKHKDTHIDALDNLLATNRPAAIGEIGLDFFLKNLDKHRQHELFIGQLKLAQKHQLPVILHVRKAHDQTLHYLESHPVKGGFIHAFNGTLEHARRYIELGFKLGFGGAVTWPTARKIHLLAKNLPVSSIVLETDAPDMAVESLRGRSCDDMKPLRNSPEYLLEIIESVAAIRSTAIDKLATHSTQNALSILEPNKTRHDSH